MFCPQAHLFPPQLLWWGLSAPIICPLMGHQTRRSVLAGTADGSSGSSLSMPLKSLFGDRLCGTGGLSQVMFSGWNLKQLCVKRLQAFMTQSFPVMRKTIELKCFNSAEAFGLLEGYILIDWHAIGNAGSNYPLLLIMIQVQSGFWP